MAIQNDNTFLSKGDLKAYHEKILPYLGGNMMMSTNNSTYYSMDEKVVGIWVDGKPLYSKTLTGSTSIAGNAWSDTGIITPSNITLIDLLPIQYPDGSQCQTIPCIGYIENNHLLIFNIRNNTYAVAPIYATIFYTKTTDTASTALTTPGAYDVNFPNTWPANKEIYFGNGVYGYRATGTHNIEESARVDTNIVDIGVSSKFVSFGGSVSWSSNVSGTDIYQNPLPFDSPLSDGSRPVSVQLLRAGNGEVKLRTWGNLTYSNLPYDIWFTYTK